MFEEELIGFCEEKLNSMCDGQCRNCNHPTGAVKYECNGDCDKCFEEIHFEQGELLVREDYNCQKLIYNYVPKYFERYTNNIEKILDFIDLSNYENFKIFSIGCGPAPDLNAFCELNPNKRIDYYGIDRNEKWEPIHNEIKKITKPLTSVAADFKSADIFDIIEDGETFEGYNVLVIQYLVSHLFNTEQDNRIDDLFDFICTHILSDRQDDSPFLIIINDIDTYSKGRNYFWHLIDFVEQAGCYGKAYAISDCSTGDLGVERWTRNQFSNTFENISYKYITPYPKNFEGAALIIEVD